jgi:polynucleotide 5'-hydroxyl-kinase GRC3/NOL9
MVIGAADTGKTRFCANLANRAIEAGIPTAIVDADIGQSEIGSPGTIGLATPEAPFEAATELQARRLYFVGSTSPPAHLLEHVTGTKRLVDNALELGAKLVIVDTTGLTAAPVGRKLKTYKVDLVRPKFLVGIERAREIEPLLAPFCRHEEISVILTKTPEEVRMKSPQLRATRRQANFHRRFHDAMGYIIKLDDVCCWNTWLGTGRPVKWQYVKFIERALRCAAEHVELVGGSICAVVDGEPYEPGIREVQQQFKTRDIRLATTQSFQGLLVGLADQNGRTMEVGLVQGLEFKQRLLYVLSPIRTVSPVRVVQFGSIRLSRDGRELGFVRQADI